MKKLLVLIALLVVGFLPREAVAQSWTMRAQDHFTDADGTNLTAHTPDLGSGWSQDSGTLETFFNALTSVSSDGYYRNLTVLGSKQYVQMKVVARARYPGILLCTHFSGGNFTGYFLLANSAGALEFRKFTGSGTADTVISSYPAVADGQTIRMTFDGVNTLAFFIDGVLLDGYTDISPVVGGYSGAFSYDAASGDDFEAGDDAVGARVPAGLLPFGAGH